MRPLTVPDAATVAVSTRTAGMLEGPSDILWYPIKEGALYSISVPGALVQLLGRAGMEQSVAPEVREALVGSLA